VGWIVTVTTADCGVRRRAFGLGTPIVTVCLTVFDALATETGSVVADVNSWSALTGPATSTVFGSTMMAPTSKPDAGLPVTSG
jgi:hypothetical protein